MKTVGKKVQWSNPTSFHCVIKISLGFDLFLQKVNKLVVENVFVMNFCCTELGPCQESDIYSNIVTSQQDPDDYDEEFILILKYEFNFCFSVNKLQEEMSHYVPLDKKWT